MPAIDKFLTFVDSPLAGGTVAVAISPDDANDLPTAIRAVWVGGTGTLKVTTVGGSVVVFAAVPVGIFDLVRIARVWATGTTATLLIGVQ